jgi:hypothetical protein
MDKSADPKARVARILFPTGIALLLGGAALGATVQPWWIGALVAGAGAMDLMIAFLLWRMAGPPR